MKNLLDIFKKEYASWIIMSLSVGILTFLSLLNLNKSSIWFDEAFSAYISQYNLFDIAKYTAQDVHPPFYYWLLHGWTGIFGLSETSIRSMSLLFGCLTVILAFLIVRKMFGARIAGITSFFVAISPMLFRYSIEARMYTLETSIIMLATLVLLYATSLKSKKLWTSYGILVGVGMLTHYFTALAWIAHLVWHSIKSFYSGPIKTLQKRILDRNWVWAYCVAFACYLIWLPFMVYQLFTIQAYGFWIAPVGIDSIGNFVTNTFYYLEQDQVMGWAALVLIIIISMTAYIGPRVYKKLDQQGKSNYMLLLVSAVVPTVVLFLVSLPPLKSSFLERYLIPASVYLIMFISVSFLIYFRNVKKYILVAIMMALAAAQIYGVYNVAYYGNFNKNNNSFIYTRELIEGINKNTINNVPIIASTPWMYYEAFIYKSNQTSLYFVDSGTDYKYGSLAMLKDTNKDKIYDLDEYLKRNPKFWYIGFNNNSQSSAPYQNIKELERFEITSEFDKTKKYEAILYEYLGATSL